jgi:hypothetical protein
MSCDRFRMAPAEMPGPSKFGRKQCRRISGDAPAAAPSPNTDGRILARQPAYGCDILATDRQNPKMATPGTLALRGHALALAARQCLLRSGSLIR